MSYSDIKPKFNNLAQMRQELLSSDYDMDFLISLSECELINLYDIVMLPIPNYVDVEESRLLGANKSKHTTGPYKGKFKSPYKGKQ